MLNITPVFGNVGLTMKSALHEVKGNHKNATQRKNYVFYESGPLTSSFRETIKLTQT